MTPCRLREDPSKEFPVKLRGVWTGRWAPFNYDTDLHPHSMAKIIAVEPWSRDYFKRLRRCLCKPHFAIGVGVVVFYLLHFCCICC